MANLDSYMKHLQAGERNVLKYILKAGREISPRDLANAQFEEGLISRSLDRFKREGIIEARDGEKGETLYSIKK